MKIYIKSVTKITYLGLVIRCWRKEEKYNPKARAKTIREIEERLHNTGEHPIDDAYGIAEHLLKIEGMNAVEVTKNGNGVKLQKVVPSLL